MLRYQLKLLMRIYSTLDFTSNVVITLNEVQFNFLNVPTFKKSQCGSFFLITREYYVTNY